MQLAINFIDTRSRRTDPATSKRAGLDSVRFSGGQKGRILDALKQHGPMSPKRLFDFTGLSVVQCDRRRQEMLRSGAINIHRDELGNVVEDQGCEVWVAA